MGQCDGESRDVFVLVGLGKRPLSVLLHQLFCAGAEDGLHHPLQHRRAALLLRGVVNPLRCLPVHRPALLLRIALHRRRICILRHIPRRRHATRWRIHHSSITVRRIARTLIDPRLCVNALGTYRSGIGLRRPIRSGVVVDPPHPFLRCLTAIEVVHVVTISLLARAESEHGTNSHQHGQHSYKERIFRFHLLQSSVFGMSQLARNKGFFFGVFPSFYRPKSRCVLRWSIASFI